MCAVGPGESLCHRRDERSCSKMDGRGILLLPTSSRVQLKDPFCLSSFYNYTFDYLLLEKGSNATALTKEDSINVWNVLDFGKKWALYSKWIDFWFVSLIIL